MSELRLLSQLREELAPDDLTPPPSLRARVLADVEGAEAGGTRTGGTRTGGTHAGGTHAGGTRTGGTRTGGTHAGSRVLAFRSRGHRPAPGPGRRPLLVAAAAAAVTGALVLAPTLLPGDDGQAPAGSAAAAVFERAARTAQKQPPLQIPAGGYVYLETTNVDHYGPQDLEREPEPTYKPEGIWEDRRHWRSPDGDRTGLIKVSGRPDRPDTRWQITLDPPDAPAYLSDLPTTTAGMLDYFYDHGQGDHSPDVQAAETVADLLSTSYIPPDRMAVLFRAAAKIPGSTVVEGRHDILDRPAIAVAWAYGEVRKELLFDPTTFTYLGDQIVQTATSKLGPKGAVTNGHAVTRVTAAPKLGVVP